MYKFLDIFQWKLTTSTSTLFELNFIVSLNILSIQFASLLYV